MSDEPQRPYYEPSVLRAKREQREQQEESLLITALKAAFDFGKALIVLPDSTKIETPHRKK